MRTGELIHDSPKNRIEIGLLQFRQPYTAGCPRIVFSREYGAEEDSLRAISFFDALACMGGDPDVASLLKGRLEHG